MSKRLKNHHLIKVIIWLTVVIIAGIGSFSIKSNYSDQVVLKESESYKNAEVMGKLFANSKGDQEYTDQITILASKEDKASIAFYASLSLADKMLGAQKYLSKIEHPQTLSVEKYTITYKKMSLADHQKYSSIIKEKLKNLETAKLKFMYLSVVDIAPPAHDGKPKNTYGEIIGLFLALLVILYLVKSPIGALIPIVVAGSSLIISTTILKILSMHLEIASFAPQLSSLVGLGVGVDYSLLLLLRYKRERLNNSHEVALKRASKLAGRAILIAGSIVGISILGMNVMGIKMLAGVSYGVTITVLITALLSLVVTPSLIYFGRKNIDKNSSNLKQIDDEKYEGRSKKDYIKVISIAILMLVIATPVLSMKLGTVTTRDAAFVKNNELFKSALNDPIYITIKTRTPADKDTVGYITQNIEKDKSITASPVFARSTKDNEETLLTVTPLYDSSDIRAQDIVKKIREKYTTIEISYINTHIEVGGTAAVLFDFKEKIMSKFIFFIFAILLLSSIIIFFLYRSFTIPLTSILANLLSTGATFGITALVFQRGYLGSLLGINPGPIEPFLLVIGISVLFGLSMDYQVFLLSSIEEEYLRSRNTFKAINYGLNHTRRVITSAAIIMVAIFLSFVLGGDRIIKEFGFTLATAVFIDAFLVRIIFIPSLMRILGEFNWLFPEKLKRYIKPVHHTPDLGE